MSKRYKGKDAHYRLQIKKDGEWQDLGLVASAEMDNKNVDDTTTTNFDEKYIHRNNDKNDAEENDVKVTDLTFQTSKLGKTPKIIFKNIDTSTQDLAEIYLDTQKANKSTLRFVVGDDKGGESAGNNETISFDWRNGDENTRATYYTFTESELKASEISASFKKGMFSNTNGNALEVTGHLKMQSGSTICPDNKKGIYFSGANDQARIYSTTTEAAKIYSTTTRDNQINYSSIDDDSALNITVAGDATKAADSDASALNFLITDNNNDKINFRWSVWDGDAGSGTNPVNAYSFSKTSLNASGVTAKFATIQSNTYYNSDGTKMLDFYPTDKKWETNIYNGKAGQDSTLSIWGSTENDTAEASIQYRNKTDGESWTVGVNTDGRKDNSFAWYSHKSQAGNRMWLTHDGELHIGNKISIYSTPNSTHKDEQTNLIVRPNEISFASFDKLSALSYVNGGTGSTDWFKLALGNEGDEPLEFNWVNGAGNIVENRKGWLQYPGATRRNDDPQLIWSSELDARLNSELTQRTNDLTFKQNTDKGIKWQNETDTARIYTEGVLNDLSLVLEVRDDGNEKIVFRGKQNGSNDQNVTVTMGTLTADRDIVATNSFKLGNNATMSYNNADQCVDFLF